MKVGCKAGFPQDGCKVSLFDFGFGRQGHANDLLFIW